MAVAFILAFYYIAMLCSVFWIYQPEVLNDNQLGVTAGSFYIFGIVVSLVQEYMVDSLGVDGTFFLFAFTSFLGIFYLAIFLKESKGLTDREKKELYYPDEFKTKPSL